MKEVTMLQFTSSFDLTLYTARINTSLARTIIERYDICCSDICWVAGAEPVRDVGECRQSSDKNVKAPAINI